MVKKCQFLTKSCLDSLYGLKLEQWLRKRKVAVLGLGRTGIAVAQILEKLDAEIFLSDSKFRSQLHLALPPSLKKMRAEFGHHSAKIFSQDLIVVSPGVDWNLPLLVQARKKGKMVWGELELAYRLSNFKKIVAITGTNGKTTTVSLIGDICKRSGKKTLVAGNIGKPLIEFVIGKRDFDLVILEVSSYQLEGIQLFHPHLAGILNLSCDHLSRHKTMQNYAKIKGRIFMNQTSGDIAILNQDNPWCRKLAKNCPSSIVWFSTKKKLRKGIYFDGEKIVAQRRYFPPPKNLLGTHNIENSCAAIAVAQSLHLPAPAIKKSLLSFRGVEHRLEKVKVAKGITYINDSKATNVESTGMAIQSISSPLWLILGGEDKGSSYAPLKPLIAKKVKGIFLIGDAAKKIQSELSGICNCYLAKTLKNAVTASFQKASDGETVLLSPACASFDQFKNFEDRGEQFKKLVWDLG